MSLKVRNPDVAPEVLAKAITDLAQGVKKLRQGPLTDKALLLLIQHSAPTKANSSARYGLNEIKDILQGIEDLERNYVKKGFKNA